MSCLYSTELGEELLWMYVDNEAELEVVQHIEQCSYCRSRVEALRQQNAYLHNNLHWGRAPSRQELGEYLLGLSPPERAETVKRYLSDFPTANYELNEIRAYLNEVVPEPILASEAKTGFVESIKLLTAQLVTAPTMVTQRDLQFEEEEPKPIIYEAGEMRVILEIEEDEQFGLKCISGLVVGANSNETTVYLWQVEPPEEVASVQVADDAFELSGLRPNLYQLIVRSPDSEILIENIKIGI